MFCTIQSSYCERVPSYRADKQVIDTQVDRHLDVGNGNTRRPKLASGYKNNTTYCSEKYAHSPYFLCFVALSLWSILSISCRVPEEKWVNEWQISSNNDDKTHTKQRMTTLCACFMKFRLGALHNHCDMTIAIILANGSAASIGLRQRQIALITQGPGTLPVTAAHCG